MCPLNYIIIVQYYSLSFLKFPWSYLSGSTKSELLRLLNNHIPQLTEPQFKKLLYSLENMKATYEDIKPISPNILKMAEKYCLTTDNFIHYFN